MLLRTALALVLVAAMEAKLGANPGRIAERQADAKQYLRPCYFTNWAQYRQGRGKYVPEDYIPGLCTHMLFAFGWMNEDFTLKAFDPADLDQSWAKGMYSRVNDLKRIDPELKTLLSIGGWTFGTRLFKAMSKTSEGRRVFIDSAIAFVRLHKFDGLDIDWEYPQGPEDIENYSKLIKETRQAFDAEIERTSLPRLLLSAAVSAGEGTIKNAYDIPEIARWFDFILLMSYDFHGAWETTTGMNSPLFPRKDEIFWQQVWNVDWAANHWHQQGMPKEKIIIGIPTYGRGWTLKSPQTDNKLGARTSGPAKTTKFVGEAGVAAYYEFCELLAQGAERFWNEEHQVPYLIKGDQWFGYDDEESIRRKMAWLKEKGYGGAFVWTLDFDDFNGKCSNGGRKKYPLISILKEELTGTAPQTPKPRVTTTTQKPETSESCRNKPDGFHNDPNKCRKFLLCLSGKEYSMKCPGNLEWSSANGFCVEGNGDCERRTPRPTTTSSAPSMTETTPPRSSPSSSSSSSSSNEQTTAASTSPTTPSKHTGFQCPSDGFHPDPECCSKFFRCVSGTPHAFSCPGETHFQPKLATCVHPVESKCMSPNDC